MLQEELVRGLISKTKGALAITFLASWLFGRRGRNLATRLVCHVIFSLTCDVS